MSNIKLNPLFNNISFSKTDGIHTLNDCLNLPLNANYTDAELEQMKQDRFDNWVAYINLTITDIGGIQ